MDSSDYIRRIAELERENRILKQKINRSIENRIVLEEALETHSNALKIRNAELEQSRERLKESEARYRYLAHYDSLTNIPNRAYFHTELQHAISRSEESDTWIALLFIDLDQFKNINDNFGHEVGDALLKQTANRLLTCLQMACPQMSGMVARLGGDEFAVLLEDINDFDLVESQCKTILEALSQPFCILDHTCTIGASIGVSICPLDDTNADKLIKKSDSAMYLVKKSGANGYHFFGA